MCKVSTRFAVLLLTGLLVVSSAAAQQAADTSSTSPKSIKAPRVPYGKAERYFVVGGGWAYANAIDLGQSRSLFSSDIAAFSIQAGMLKRRTRSLSEFTYQYAQATLTPASLYTEVSYQRFDVGYRYLTRVWHFRRGVSLFAGGEFANTIVRRINPAFSNNGLTFESISSLSAALAATWPFTLWKRQWQLNGSLSTPLVAYVARPTYATTTQTRFQVDEGLGDYLDQGTIVGPDRLLRLSFLWSLDYRITNGNALRLSYGWDVYRYRPADSANATGVQSALHTLAVGWLIRF
jgi:hypothetical protein